MVNMGSLDVSSLKNGFLSMLQQAKPGVLPEFMSWLETILAEYKMTGLYCSLPNYMLQPYLQYSPTTEALKSLISRSASMMSSPRMSPSHTKHLSESPHSNTPLANITHSPAKGSEVSLRVTEGLNTKPLKANSPGLPKSQGSTLRSLLQNSSACVNLSEEFTDRGSNSDPESRNGYDSCSLRSETVSNENKTSKNYECSKCFKSFSQRSSYKRHQKIHQGLYSHFCHACEQTFARREHLIQHKCAYKPSKGDHLLSINIHRNVDKENTVDKAINGVQLPPEHEVPPPSPVDMSSKWSDISSASSRPASPNINPQESRRKTSAPRKCVFSVDSPQNEDYLSDIDESIYTGAMKTENGALDFSMKKPASKDDHLSINKASLNEAKLDLKEPLENGKEMDVTQSPQPGFRMSDLIGMAVTKYHSMIEPSAPALKPKTPTKKDMFTEEFKANNINASPKKRILNAEKHSEEYKANNPIASPKKQPNTVTDQNKITTDNIDSNFLATETGTYQITTEEVETDSLATKDEATPSKVIKVVKQGNYLKLKKEAQVIDGELRFICPHCNKVFHRSSNFSRHMRIHRGVFSYICSACNRGFYRKEHFDKHKCYRKAMATTWERKTRVEMDKEEWEKNGSEHGATDDEALHSTGTDMNLAPLDIGVSDEGSGTVPESVEKCAPAMQHIDSTAKVLIAQN